MSRAAGAGAGGHEGQLWEWPLVAVQDMVTNKIRRWGDEAAAMAGRTPPGWQVVRPWWGEEIIDRHILRALIEQILAQARQSNGWQGIFLPFHELEVVISPTISPLHQRWLERTLREAGVWRWRVVDPYRRLVARKKNLSVAAVPATAILDIGFSTVRALVYIDNQLVWSQRSADMALCQFCADLCQREQRAHGQRFAPSVFYDQQWFTQHVGYDERNKRPMQAALSPRIFQAQYDEWLHDLTEWLTQGLSEISPDIQALIAQAGWLVVGGGAILPDLATQLKKHADMLIKIHADPRYAHIRYTAQE